MASYSPFSFPVLGKLGQILHQILLRAVVHGNGLHLMKKKMASYSPLSFPFWENVARYAIRFSFMLLYIRVS
jgi:hypothetical protein